MSALRQDVADRRGGDRRPPRRWSPPATWWSPPTQYEAVPATDVSLICVGTPSAAGGALLTRYLEEVTAEIGGALRDKDGWHVVVYRSTMAPEPAKGC